MAIRAKPCSILGTFCFRVGSVIALAGARDLLAIGTKSGSFSKVFWTLGGVGLVVRTHTITMLGSQSQHDNERMSNGVLVRDEST